MAFDILKSEKLSGGWKEQYRIVRAGVLYLRIVGDGQNFRIMTATAADANSAERICSDTRRLHDAGIAVAKEYKVEAVSSEDRQDRSYIRIFEISQEEGESNDKFTQDVVRAIDRFFEFFDSGNQ